MVLLRSWLDKQQNNALCIPRVIYLKILVYYTMWRGVYQISQNGLRA